MAEVGFTVIEWNQASGRPEILGPLVDGRAEAEEIAQGYRIAELAVGEGEQ